MNKSTIAALLGVAATSATLLTIGTVKDADDKDVTTYEAVKIDELPDRLKTAPVLDAKTAAVLVPAGPRHTFGQHESDCADGARYCSILYDAATDKLDLAHCYAVTQHADAEGSPVTYCQVTRATWEKMQPPDLDDGGPVGGDAEKPVKPVIIRK
jgi:hypothetical protein